MEKAVKRGYKLLSSNRLSWEDEVDLKSLNMSSCFSCVLGQVYGSYVNGVRILGIAGATNYYGFNTSTNSAKLTRLWRKQITKSLKRKSS